MSILALYPARNKAALRETKTALNRTAAQKPTPDTASQLLTRGVHAAISQATFRLSPAALANTLFDWWVHLALSPGKLSDLAQLATAGATDNLAFAARCVVGSPSDPSERALAHDERFRGPDWQHFPFNIYAHNFLSIERWWDATTSNLRGVSQRHDNMANFVARQILDTVAPSNFIPTNPEVLARTRAELGIEMGGRCCAIPCGPRARKLNDRPRPRE